MDSSVFCYLLLVNIRVQPTTACLAWLSPAIAWFAGQKPGSAEEVPIRALTSFFDAHCYECHDDLTTKAGLDLYSIDPDLSDEAALSRWVRIFDRIDHGEMPPKDKPRPAASELASFREALAPYLVRAHASQKGTILRRLNRLECENTLNDLLGIRIDAVGRLPEDGRSHEFDTNGKALGISMIQMQRYLEIAGDALEEAIAKTTSSPDPTTIVTNYRETREWEQHGGKAWLEAPDGSVVFFREIGYPSGMLRTANTRKAGNYRIRITGYAYQSDKPVTFSVGAMTFARGSERPIFSYESFPPGAPTTVELTAWIDRNYMIEITPKGIYDHENLIREHGIKNYKGPGLAITSVELEGPIVDRFPTIGHELIFNGLDRREIEPSNPSTKTKSWYVPEFEIVSEDPANDVIPTLKRFASAAFRRPVIEREIAPYHLLFQAELQDGASIEEALRTSLVAILCSPDFLYLRETTGPLDDHALASRLSYFLVRSAPDAELREVAELEQLTRDPAMLQKQAERLIAHPKFDRFLIDFTDSWLDLRSIEFTNPEEKLYPEFDRFLQESMLAETRAFFREQIRSNLPIESVVKSDFAMLNSRLAEHYGIDGVSSPKIERVSLPEDSPRGGFLSQASILKVSANGTNTSPVLRGVWVNERILGQHPAPPPPGIPGVEPDIRGAETLRQILDQHRDSESCQACHEMIDPPGFALESFNPIGGWRDRFRSLGEGEKPEIRRAGNNFVRYRIGLPVDASGVLQDGTAFSGFREYRDLIAEDRDQLAKALLTKLLAFSTGREMGFSDRAEIDRLVQRSAENGHGIRGLVLLAISSDIFQTK